MSDLIQFDFSSNSVRVILRDGDPWFVATDIADALGYRDSEKMTRMLDDDEKGTHNVGTLGGDQEMTVINESGLYAAILKSRKPEAKKFKKWVTSEVLPSIRKTGSYTTAAASTDRYSTETITRQQYQELRQIVGEIGAMYRQRGSAEFAAWRTLKKPYGLRDSKSLPVSDFEQVLHHLSEMKRISARFRDLILEAESKLFRASFGADAMPSESQLSQLSSEQIEQMALLN